MHFLLVRFHNHENLGIVPDILVETGIRWTTVDADAPLPDDLSHIDGIIVYGGVPQVWEEDKYSWLPAIKTFLRNLIEQHTIPILGICLGHQLIAAAAGGNCREMQTNEVGMRPVHTLPEAADDALLCNFSSGTPVLQWHGAEVSKLPSNAVLLANNEACAIQAFRLGSLVWGLQFHIEGTSTTVPVWASTKESVADLEKNMGPDGYWIFRNEALEHMPAQMAEARKIFGNFIAVAKQAEQLRQVEPVKRTAAQS